MLWAQASAILWLIGPSIASSILQREVAAASSPIVPLQSSVIERSAPTLTPPETAKSVVPRSSINTHLCSPQQHHLIITSLIRAQVWSELASIKCRRDQSHPRDEVILSGVFNRVDVSDRERGYIEQRYHALIWEVQRWDGGRLVMACATDMWRACWIEQGVGRSRLRRILIDVHVAEGLFVLCPRFFTENDDFRLAVLITQLTRMRTDGNLPTTTTRRGSLIDFARLYGDFARDIAYNYRRDVEQMVRGLELAYRLQHLDQEWFE